MPKISKDFDFDLAEKILCGISDEIDPTNIPEWVDDFREWIFWEASKADVNYESEGDDDVKEKVVISKEDTFYKIDDVITKDVLKNEVVLRKKILTKDIE